MSAAAVAARVASVGLACPLGLSTSSTMAAIDAGLSRFNLVESVLDPAAQPVAASRLEQPAQGESRLERAISLGVAAVKDALSTFTEKTLRGPVPCVLAAPEPTAGGDLEAPALVHGIRAALQDHPIELEWPAKLSATQGRAAFFDALESAIALLATKRAPIVLVGATDCLVDESTLQGMTTNNRHLSKTNLDGAMFGEAASFVLLAHPHSLPAAQSRGEVLSIADAVEPRPITSADPSTSLGLAELFRKLRATHPDRVGAVFCGVSCEGFYGMELSNAYLRNAALMPEPFRSHTIGNTLGDVGAASGAVAFAQAITSLQPRRGPAVRSALAYGSSDGGAVRGCIVRRS